MISADGKLDSAVDKTAVARLSGQAHLCCTRSPKTNCKMKTRLLFSALGLLMLMAACQKEEQTTLDQTFAPPPSDRCGCMAPTEISAQNATDISVDLNWNATPEAIAYVVEVADAFYGPESFGTIIFRQRVEGTRVQVTHLAPNTTYAYRIASVCGNDESTTSEILHFTTGDFNHGDPDPRKTKATPQQATELQ
ncbi:MAG: fibronectin type III domain-containing protein [Bacteroidetes bacterium]|nr:MAG: fibronectin type III domain-containing protein [Bacteroidota bacterium]